jgi:hypothetical protein
MSLGLVLLIGAIILNIYSIVKGLITENAFYWVSFLNIIMWLILLPVAVNFKP